MSIKLKLKIKKLALLLLCVFSFGFFISSANAATGINKQINFQGKLVNADGTNVADTSYSVVFTLYDASSGGTNLWDETQSVSTTNGIFQVSLGSVDTTLGNVNFNTDNLFLGIKVGADSEMTPRVRFAAVPYAFNAEKVAGLTVTNTTGTFTLTNAKTLAVNNSLTFAGTDGTTITFQGTDTYIGRGTTDTLINKTIGSTGLVFSGAATDITTATNEGLTFTANGTGDFVFTTDADTTFAISNLINCDTIDSDVNGVLTCGSDASGGGGGGSSNWTLANGVLRPNNNTADFLIGGVSTASAKFSFGNLNSGTPTATFSGDLIINNRSTTSVAEMQKWTKLTGTAGTIGGGTAGVASISASVVYNGSLYVGTNNANQAEVYRYDGAGAGTWTKVSGTAGTIGGGATTAIDMISSMTVYNGYLYAGTQELDKAEIYRYDGGSTWTKVSAAAAGTILTTTLIDGVTAMAVHGGRLYAGTKEGAKAELYRYNGGTSWTAMTTTAGTFVTTNSAAVNAVSSMISWNGALYLGLMKTGDADIVRMNSVGASTFISLNAVGTTGSYAIDGAAVTAFDDVPAMTVWGGRLVAGLRKLNAAEVIEYTGPGGSTNDAWARFGSAAGTITSGGTASIDSIGSLAVYSGRLYVGTTEPDKAEILRFDEKGSWTKVSQNTAGMIAGGGTAAIDSIATLIPYNQSLFAGTLEGTSAEGYSYASSIDQSYALKFHAGASQAGGEQNGQPNLASIFFVASLSANVNNKAGNTGAFVFSHSIVTNNGSYDVAEDYPTRDDTLESGDVVSIDPNERGFVKKSEGAYDYAVIGVYSEKPALRLSQQGDVISGGHAIPIALAGRVPVKVSTENGEIKNGDYLTASSVAGVAMKAKKSGVVIGQAMESYAGEGVGKVLVYIKSSSYQGTIAANFTHIDMKAQDSGEQILASLQSQEGGLVQSEMVTDLLVADKIIARSIKAEKIEGLDFLIARILGASSSGVIANQVGQSPEMNDEIASSSSAPRNDELALKSLSVEGLATVSANLRVKNNTLIEGILTVIDTLTSRDLIVNGLATFFGDVVFKGNVSFSGHPIFSNDTAGIAVVKKDSDRVEVLFAKEYEQAPVVNASISIEEEKETKGTEETEEIHIEKNVLAGDMRYVVTKRTTKGFTILLNKPVTEDVSFSWIALGVAKPLSLKSPD